MLGNQLDLLGINFNSLSLSAIIEKLTQRQPTQRFTYIVTPNADHIARLQRCPGLRLVYDAAWLRVLDSKLIWLVARLLRLPVPQVTTGADITAALLSQLSAQTIAIIGMSFESFQALQSRYPNLTIVHHTPPQNLLHNQPGFCRARDFAVSTNAQFTFIALGSPLQELLAYDIACQPNAQGVGLCIGIALEFCAGTQPRAPAWMRNNGLEWLHRLACNPRRLAKRYLVDDPPVLLALFRQACRRLFLNQRLPALRGATSGRGLYPPPQPAHLQKTLDAG